ncbi:helix-turn-helix domain-containing protein [Variovorax sp. PDC80]|jgi:AraC family transcriptional regulator, arabinose operon regulatory protein|uniref:helix-turn-helix domain-containing protein n=1 Tax=unclassified Variovorax TaxID=663243 RepID=UPI0008F32F44|nr:helix-turn-helix domain-containing protein [Variovorax sp. PDC80]SFO07783.1 transcriptional regulator, AraC family [Variovorax sp. PDC80]
MATPKNFLHLWDDRFLYITPAIQSGLTARSSATVLASVSGHPFMLEAADGTRTYCTAAVVAPHVARRLAVEGCGLLSLNIDPASVAYRMLSRQLGGHGIQVLDARRFGRLREGFEPAQAGALDDAALQALSRGLVETITGSPERRMPNDPRIERVLDAIRHRAGAVSLRELSAVACLSPDRLTHLFAQQVGVSIKRYALWTKVRRTVQQFTGQRPLTDVALTSGFTDAAHMSRTFKSYFGLAPSFLAGKVEVRADEQASQAWGHGAAPMHS